MAIITLHQPNEDRKDCNFVDLNSGIAGRASNLKELQASVPAAAIENHSVLAAGNKGLLNALSIHAFVREGEGDEKRRIEFDSITYDNVSVLQGKSQVNDLRFRNHKLSDLTGLVGGSILILKTNGADKQRYFKVMVRRGVDADGFSAKKIALLFEEIVEGRIIIPLDVTINHPAGGGPEMVRKRIRKNPAFASGTRHREMSEFGFHTDHEAPVEGVDATIEHLGIQITTDEKLRTRVPLSVNEVLWTLRHDHTTESRDEDFYDVLYPLVKVEFAFKNSNEETEFVFRREPPAWQERMEVRTIAASTYLNSSILLRLDNSRRPSRRLNEPNRYYYTVYLVGGVQMVIKDWDPELIPDKQN